jgi:hypothetical protein
LKAEGKAARRRIHDKHDGELFTLALVHGHHLDAVGLFDLLELDLKPSEKIKVVEKI